MADNLYGHIIPNIWPSNSPDLDYHVMSVVEKEVNEHTNNTKNTLKAAIVHVMSDMHKEQLIRVCNWFRPLNEAVINASRAGGYWIKLINR